MNKNIKKLFVIITTFVIICSQSVMVSAYTKSVSETYRYPTDSRHEWRFVTITGSDSDAKWTKYHYISGQPKKGTWLKKGDLMFYQSNGGSNSSLSFTVGYGFASVSLDIPIGKISSTSYGVAKQAQKKGWYKIKLKKLVKPIVVYKQSRSYQYSYPRGYSWTEWSTSIYSKKNVVLQEKAVLEKQ